MTDQRPTVDPESGMHKYDQDKPRVELLPARVLKDVAEILSFGADKYEDHNWRKGTKWSRFYGAALRHLFAWSEGEDADPESGLPHLAHALCCIMFLQEYSHSDAGEDDRWDTLTGAIYATGDLAEGPYPIVDDESTDQTHAGDYGKGNTERNPRAWRDDNHVDPADCDHCTKPAGTYDGIEGGRPACVCANSCDKDICRFPRSVPTAIVNPKE